MRSVDNYVLNYVRTLCFDLNEGFKTIKPLARWSFIYFRNLCLFTLETIVTPLLG